MLTPSDEEMRQFLEAQAELIKEGVSPIDTGVDFLVRAARRAGWSEEQVALLERAMGA